MTQPSLFDTVGQRRRDRIMDIFESRAQAWLWGARVVARTIARERGTVTSDDVIGVIGEPPPDVSRNVVGAIFRRGGWRRVGVVASRRPTSHASIIGVWEAVNAA